MASNWVDDLSSLQGKPGLVKKPQSRKEHIEAELKLLEWHKLANEAAIKVLELAFPYCVHQLLMYLSHRLLYYKQKT